MLSKEDIKNQAQKYKDDNLIAAFIEGAEYQRVDDEKMIMMLKDRIGELANELSELKHTLQ